MGRDKVLALMQENGLEVKAKPYKANRKKKQSTLTIEYPNLLKQARISNNNQILKNSQYYPEKYYNTAVKLSDVSFIC